MVCTCQGWRRQKWLKTDGPPEHRRCDSHRALRYANSSKSPKSKQNSKGKIQRSSMVSCLAFHNEVANRARRGPGCIYVCRKLLLPHRRLRCTLPLRLLTNRNSLRSMGAADFRLMRCKPQASSSQSQLLRLPPETRVSITSISRY